MLINGTLKKKTVPVLDQINEKMKKGERLKVMFASGLQKSYLKKNCNENTKIKQTMRLELEEVETMNNAAGTTMLMTMSLFPIVKTEYADRR